MQADGTVLIDTEIDTSGMKPGTKEVEAAVRRMANGIDDLGKKSEIAVQKQAAAFAKLNTQYAAQEQKVKKLREELEAYAETKIPTQEYLEIQTQIEKTEQKLSAFTIGRQVVFSLGGWSPHVQTGYHVSRPTHAHILCSYVYVSITLSPLPFHAVLLEHIILLGSFPFARRYLGNLG